jgi:hypothetical protein
VQKILRERGIRHVIGLGTVAGGEVEIEGVPAPAAPAAAIGERLAPAATAGGNGAAARPQRDLFEPAGRDGTVTAPLERPVSAAAEGPKDLDKEALKALLAELEALRAVMTGRTKG